jgi:hypothetical protein
MSEERRQYIESSAMIGTVVGLSAERLTCTVKAIPGHVNKLRQMPFMQDAAVMPSLDWYATTQALKDSTFRIVELECECINLRNDVERIGRERDDMARAAQELQERLSAMEAAHVPDV